MLKKQYSIFILFILSFLVKNVCFAESITMFGAKGDGKTNDTEAFLKASAWLNKNKTGKLFFPRGTYMVGRQTFDGTLKGSAYNGTNLLTISDAQNIVIEGDKAVIKFIDNLKFCAYDPISGKKIANTRDYAYRAEIGECFQLTNCKNVTIKGFELDGNCDKVELGGNWYETGYEGLSAGIALRDVSNVLVEDCYIHHFPLDGIYLHNVTKQGFATPSQNITLKNTELSYNCRQGMSWVGGIGITAIDCKFNHTGQAKWASAPSHGVDIEPEAGNVCKKGKFIRCVFSNNKGLAVCTQRQKDGEDFYFEKCTFEAIDYYCVMVSAPRTKFKKCNFYGSTVLYPHANKEKEGVFFNKCNFKEKKTVSGKKVFGDALIVAENVKFTKINKCNFETQSHYQAIFYRNDETIKNNELPFLSKNNFILNSPALDDEHFVVLLRRINANKNTLNNKLPSKKHSLIAKEINTKNKRGLKSTHLKILE
jgi:Pectate lyase superfamily protein